MAIAIHAIFGQERVALTTQSSIGAPAVVPAAYLTFEIEGQDVPRSIVLDKRRVPLALTPDGKRGHFLLDAFRSVGFHCLEIEDSRFYFATEDSKLKLAGILQLLQDVGRSGLSWGHQIFFANGTVLRDRRVDYAWLVEHGPKIATVAREIAAVPLRRSKYRTREELPSGGRVLVAQTLALIRRRGTRALDLDERGFLRFGAEYYSPRLAIVTRQERSFDTIGNRRATQLLLNASDMARELLQSDMPADAKQAMTAVARELRECLQLFPFTSLTDDRRLPDEPAPEEIVDPRYSATFALDEVLRRELGWEAGIQVSADYAFVGFSDQIYQAFVASLIARAVGAAPTGPTLYSGLSRPSFRSDRYDIYYDTSPPTPEFLNWRNGSSRPSDMRPDLTIIDRVAKRGLLLDAKYRIDGDRAPTSALAECQVYMHSFQQDAIVVCYPGSAPRLDEVASGPFRIVELSLSPYPGVDTFVAQTAWPRLQALMQPLRG